MVTTMSANAEANALRIQADYLLDCLAANFDVTVRRSGAVEIDASEECAAIIEFDGGFDRATAESFARELVALMRSPNAAKLADLEQRMSAAAAAQTLQVALAGRPDHCQPLNGRRGNAAPP
jgi:hypothetical protein